MKVRENVIEIIHSTSDYKHSMLISLPGRELSTDELISASVRFN